MVSATDPFSCTLNLAIGIATLELTVMLPQGYPKLPPQLRATCACISRQGEDVLAEGMRLVVESSEGEPCMAAVLDWLQENAASHMVETDAAVVSSPDQHLPSAAQRAVLRGSRCVLWEEHGDLFEVGPEWSLCHCVSKDLEMGMGIAVDFKKLFGGLQDLHRQQPEVGGVLVLQKKGRFVYYLVTKNKAGGKPSIQTLEASLCAMKEQMAKDGVRKLAMPKIGCGLDRLSWGTVLDLLLRVFDDMDVELQVRSI